MRKVVITGAECSGKSTLSKTLAGHYAVRWVPEMAREYIDALGHPYGEDDLLEIAKLQLKSEAETVAQSGGDAPLLIADTDLITIRIWGEEKYSRSDPWIVKQTKERPYDLWLLCRPDIPWVYDPQRENPHDRDRLFAVYERTLKALRKPYAIVGGSEKERLRQAVKAIEDRFGQ